jgi:hypothetical protein
VTSSSLKLFIPQTCNTRSMSSATLKLDSHH